MIEVCYRYDYRSELMNLWEYTLSNFPVDKAWIRDAPVDYVSFHKPCHIKTALELPNDKPLIIFSHQEGRNYQGQISLVDFVHPKDAIYFFGGDHVILDPEEDLGGRVPDSIVYIPSGPYEMYSFVAGAVVLYDRLLKDGRSNYGQQNIN